MDAGDQTFRNSIVIRTTASWTREQFDLSNLHTAAATIYRREDQTVGQVRVLLSKKM